MKAVYEYKSILDEVYTVSRDALSSGRSLVCIEFDKDEWNRLADEFREAFPQMSAKLTSSSVFNYNGVRLVLKGE